MDFRSSQNQHTLNSADLDSDQYMQLKEDYDFEDFQFGNQYVKMGVKRVTMTTLVLTSILVASVGIGLGVIIGWFSSQGQIKDEVESYKVWFDALQETDEAGVTEMILEEMNPDNIRESLRYLTSKPHLAGTTEDLENANYVKEQWDSQGLESTRIMSYDVLLSYPDKDDANYVTILNDDNSTFFQSQPEEAQLDPGERHPDAVFPFNAYAPAGTVKENLVYVNYGRAEDFTKLENELHINVSGTIAIARYGKIYRGDKENQAYLRGVKGLILYSDPADYAIDGQTSVYPNTWYLPESGIQRGSVFRPNGDPLTPGYPATENAFREREDDVELPHIPVQPIGYGDAIQILEQMDGPLAPTEWTGHLDVQYKLGPGLINDRKVELQVNNHNEQRNTYNVIGMIKGSLEPDRYVLIGNHRDAWVFGAVDPSSGTALLLELSRVMGKLVSEGKWRPRRSILFCNWGAEEYALIGSSEWVEEFSRTIAERTVAYINIDIAVQGNYTLRAKATPNLYQAVFDAAKKVPDAPFDGHSSTVYDTWLNRRLDEETNKPYVSNVGSGSDYAVLLNRLGVPAVDVRYTYDNNLGLSSYPLYHSMYETFHLMNDIMDPSFQYHIAVAGVCGELARSLADSLIIPLKPTDYADKMSRSLNGPDGLKVSYESQLASHELSFNAIDVALAFFTTAAENIEQIIHNKEYEDDPFAVRKLNDQLMLMERAFIDPLGLPDRPLVRHVVFAPSSKNSYFGDIFPGFMDIMYDINNGMDTDEKWRDLEKHMSVIAFTIQSAATTLLEEGDAQTRPLTLK